MVSHDSFSEALLELYAEVRHRVTWVQVHESERMSSYWQITFLSNEAHWVKRWLCRLYPVVIETGRIGMTSQINILIMWEIWLTWSNRHQTASHFFSLGSPKPDKCVLFHTQYTWLSQYTDWQFIQHSVFVFYPLACLKYFNWATISHISR